ncbi:MAG: hypothetical protein DRG24_01760 [Epsilonproteobacteria bacterium]|nr:MAG: hypothetical protein DRG24_01760 [Campylobacterota bacterium]
MEQFKEFIGLGIAGNFALHLEQAGESEDFKDLKVADENGPKGMFPFYLPGFDSQLGIYPLSNDTIILPRVEANVQPEPEVALICELQYDKGQVSAILPKEFAAYNDCSIRKEGAKKISEKKNWGEASKGLSDQRIAIDSFDEGGILDGWRIASFLRREDMLLRYGEDVEISGYSYFHQKLIDWMTNQLNTQEDTGPLEPIGEYLKACGYPSRAVISIGATRYSYMCEKTYLREDDEVAVVLYDSNLYKPNDILSRVYKRNLDAEGLSVLVQQVKRA